MSEKTQRFAPYPGPRPFRIDEKDRFFGRETEARELFSLVTAHRTLLLYAQSGAGKSSLLNAGLVPLLIEEEFTTLQSGSLGGLIPQTISLSEISNVYVFSTLVCWADGRVDPKLLLKKSLSEFLREYEHVIKQSRTFSPRVLIFDQFEELFTFYPERWGDREGFFKQIGQALEEDPLARVVFAMREDYIAQLDPFCAFLPERLRTRFRLERLDKEAALLGVTEPLRGTIHTFAEGVAETLVEDLLKIRVENEVGGKIEVTEVEGEFIEPVQLQVVCQTIWQRLPPHVNVITKQHLLSVGDVDNALSQFYDDAIAAAADIIHEEYPLRDWCERYLITPMGTRGTVYREPETTGGIPNQAIDVLEDKHFIRAERRAGGRWYELTHDRFIGPIQASNKVYILKMQDAYNALLEGEQAARRSENTSALESYKRALSLYRTMKLPRGEAFALNGIGQVYLDSDQSKKAMQHFKAAVSAFLTVNDQKAAADTLSFMADTYFRAEDFEEAIITATQAIQLVPKDDAASNAMAHGRRAAAYWYSGHLEEAVDDYTRQLQFDADSSEALNGRGQCLAEMGRPSEAVADLVRAIHLAEEKGAWTAAAYARNGLALAYAGLGRYEESLEVFKRAIEGAPGNAWVYYNRARAYEWMKDPDKARENYKLALEKHDPPLNSLKRERAESYLKQSDVSK